MEIPAAVDTLDARIEWRGGVEAVDVYLDGHYKEQRSFAYQLLSKVTPLESTRTEHYDTCFSIRDTEWADFVELGEDYGLE